MLTDLPVAAVRYSALLNTSARRMDPTLRGRPFVNWIRERQGVYQQMGFDNLPWLVQWPHEKELWAIEDVSTRLKTLAAQGYRTDYGVADNVEQILAHLPDLVTSERQYLLTYDVLTPENAPGWRWHKHGAYIGTQEPRHEHLGDETDIEQIISWEVWEVLPDVRDLAGHWRPEVGNWLVARMEGELVPSPDLADA